MEKASLLNLSALCLVKRESGGEIDDNSLHAVEEAHSTDVSLVNCHTLVQYSSWQTPPLCRGQDPHNKDCYSYDRTKTPSFYGFYTGETMISAMHCHL